MGWYDEDDEPYEASWDRVTRLREDAPTPRRYALIREADERSEVNHIAEASRYLRRATEVLTPTYRRIHPLDRLKEAARKHVGHARAVRTLIGPPCPLSRIPF